MKNRQYQAGRRKERWISQQEEVKRGQRACKTGRKEQEERRERKRDGISQTGRRKERQTERRQDR